MKNINIDQMRLSNVSRPSDMDLTDIYMRWFIHKEFRSEQSAPAGIYSKDVGYLLREIQALNAQIAGKQVNPIQESEA